MTANRTQLTSTGEPVARRVDPGAGEILDVLGATTEFVTSPDAGDGAACVIRGTIPPRGVVPLHSHADSETFVAISGEVEGLVDSPEGFGWVRIRPADVFHVPGGAKHAFRNRSQEPAVNVIVTTATIGRFFREIGTPVGPGRPAARTPSDAAIEHFLETAERYGYWNATPEENAAVGLVVPAPN